MVTGIHFLLSYTCNFSCDHCFLYCSPGAKGVFAAQQIRDILNEAERLGTIETIYFEGGEPFLFYPVLLDGIRASREKSLEAHIVTNAYWATTIEDAVLWLKPLKDLGLSSISLSDDAFHYGNLEDSPPKNARKAAERLGIDAGIICIERPEVKTRRLQDGSPGDPVVRGVSVFRGRAVDTLAKGLPLKGADHFTACLQEKLDDPSRIHLDPYGNVLVCQGISIGNAFETPFSDIIWNYDPSEHPICGPLLKGGPVNLAKIFDIQTEDGYVDECHLCYLTRKALLDRYSKYLTPSQVYGVETESIA